MDVRSILAQNLRRLRAEKGLSQEGLAHQCGLDRTYVSSLERSVYAASVDVIAKLAASLDVEPFVLLKPADRSCRAQ
jgi:transcriptional regulator with XRE-family HTH domain